MSVTLDPCFQYIFGLSQTECGCEQYADDKPIDFDTSDSGIFLDEVEGLHLRLILSGANCEEGSMWDLMARARANAVKQFKSDLLACMISQSRLKREPFSGTIGDYSKFTKNITAGTTFAGLRVRIADIIGGVATLRRVGLLFNTTGLKDITIYDTTGELVATITNLPTIANKISWTTLPSPITLPTDTPTRTHTDYNFVYTVDGNLPKDMKVHCGCGSGYKPYWNSLHPSYSVPQDKGNFKWANFAMVAGIKGNAIANLGSDNDWNTQEYTNGIALDIHFGCNVETSICNESLDYTSDPYALAMAYAIRYKAAEMLVQNILTNPDPSYYTTAAPEILKSFIPKYRKEYENRVYDYLCTELVDPANINRYSDCHTCKDENAFLLTGIFK